MESVQNALEIGCSAEQENYFSGEDQTGSKLRKEKQRDGRRSVEIVGKL